MNDAQEENAESHSFSNTNMFIPHLNVPQKLFPLTGTFLKLQSYNHEHNQERSPEILRTYEAKSCTPRQQQRSGIHGRVSPPIHVICLNRILFEVETHWPL